LVLLLAWLTLLPTDGRFPQIAQFLIQLTLAASEVARRIVPKARARIVNLAGCTP
jgi:hypothetical protein